MNDFKELLNNLYVEEILTSLVFIGALVIARILLIRVTKRGNETLSKEQRRWIVRIKNTIIVLGLVGMVMIWAPQLQTLALSLTAVMVAIVIALKEVILCLTGGFVRVTTTPYRVGDWVIFDGQAGEVVDVDAFTMRLQELDFTNGSYKFTGRITTVPNSKLFTSNITNMNISRRGHMFIDVVVKIAHADIDPTQLMDEFKAIVRDVYNGNQDVDNDAIIRSVKKAGMGASSAEPLHTLQTTDLCNYVLTARLFVPIDKAQQITTDITLKTTQAAHQQRLAVQNAAENKNDKD